jgi:hypothetical protein
MQQRRTNYRNTVAKSCAKIHQLSIQGSFDYVIVVVLVVFLCAKKCNDFGKMVVATGQKAFSFIEERPKISVCIGAGALIL